MVRRIWSHESGSQTLEFVALIPMVMLVLLLMLQMALVGYSIVVVESSVREAALAAAQAQEYEDPEKKAQDAATSMAQGIHVTLESVECVGGDVTVTVKGEAPNVLFDSGLTFSRSVTMPTREGRCW